MSTLLFGLELEGVKARLWSESSADKPDASENAWDERFSGPEGSIGFQCVPAKPCRVYFTKDGYDDMAWPSDGPIMPRDGAIELRMSSNGQPPSTVGQESGQLHTEGIEFKTDQGKTWQMRCYMMHLLMVRIRNGDDIRPLIREAIGYGANCIGDIGCHLSSFKQQYGFVIDPREQNYQRWLETLLSVTAELRVRLFHRVFADAQYLNEQEQNRTWDLSQEVFKGRELAMLSLGNEAGANGYDPGRFTLRDLGGVLASRGSMGQDTPPYQHYWNVAEWETRGPSAPTYKVVDDGGAGILELQHGYFSGTYGQVGPFNCPIVVAEYPIFNDDAIDWVGDHRWTDPNLAEQLGLNTAPNCAGGMFGTSASLEAVPNQPRAAECCRRYFRGMKAGFLR